MLTKNKKIPLTECKNGFLYRIHSRNLTHGVFVQAHGGFVGIREKFGSKYLFMEYHYDTGPPYGTVHPLEELSKIPDDIVLEESLGTADDITGRLVAFDRPVDKGGKGWYFSDTGESSDDIRPRTVPNTKLFEFLRGYE